MTKQFQARWLVESPRAISAHAKLHVAPDGRVCKAPPAGVDDSMADVDLGDVVLLPGYVNAHAHLELPDLGATDPLDFVPWVGHVLARRGELSHEDYRAQVEWGARRALATGTTAVGEVNSSGAGAEFLAEFPLRTRFYREVLDGDNCERTESQIRALSESFPDGLLGGLAPHAPHTVSDRLLETCTAASRAQGLPTSVHWAETPEEVQWLREGKGPFAPFFERSPGCTGLERLQRAGLLDTPVSLVHANHPTPGELEELARMGAAVVHCPGTHAYFGRPAAEVERWIELGLPVALGTDSLASNADLDMGREMSLVRAEHPGVSAATVLEWATIGGARALDLAGQIGDLAVGKWADFLLVSAAGLESESDVLEAVTAARPEVLGVWIAGRQVWTKQTPPNQA